jgi:hypothetical protein
MNSLFVKPLAALHSTLAALAIGSLLLLPFSAPFAPAHAAATTQTTHAYLCSPRAVAAAAGPQRVTNTSSTAATQPTYNLNAAGCALIAGADVGFFLSQGYTYGPNIFTAQATAIVSSSTTAVGTGFTLPAYGMIVAVVLCETAGNAVTGGVNIGDAGSGTRFASAVALAANACVTVADSALTRIYVPSGVPTASAMLLAAVTSWNSASVNITVMWTYF